MMMKMSGPLLLGLVAITLIALFPLTAPSQPAPQKGLDCAKCHTCSDPTRVEPCLKVLCPRHQESTNLSADLGPNVVILDDLEDLYVPVRFDHKAHATMSGMMSGCETCHHFTPPNSDHPECKECHPVEIMHEDLSQPGLKGAYHRQCMGCHSDWDTDTACAVCHEKKAGGRLGGTATEVCEHSHYEPVEMLELIVFDTSYDVGDQVPFHHRNHSVLYERDCVECHSEQSCTRCHVHGQELHPMGKQADVDLHDTCYKCHSGQDCTECHGRDPNDLFTHADTGWPLKSYHRGLTCRTCHGDYGAFQKLDPKCENCHPNGWSGTGFNHKTTGVVLDEVHGEVDCETCHPDGPAKGASCEACHDDGRKYQRAKGFSGS
jgi:hypothetical protein